MTNAMHLTNRVNALLNHRGTSSEGFGTHFLPRNSSVIDLSIGLLSIHEFLPNRVLLPRIDLQCRGN